MFTCTTTIVVHLNMLLVESSTGNSLVIAIATDLPFWDERLIVDC